MHTKKVLIVGAGAIGRFLAFDLVRYGIAVKIIDKIPYNSTFTKALTINSSSLKVLQSVGLVKWTAKLGPVNKI